MVYFNSNAGALHGLLRMNDENKAKSNAIILDQLHAGGGTDIYAGLKQGANVLELRKSQNAASCIFLLTDGQDRSNKTQKIDLARSLKQNGTALFAFGFGKDHDAEHMMEISQAAEGGFSYIETDDTVVDAFGGALGSLQGSILLTKLKLSIAPSAGVIVKSVSAGRYSAKVDRGIATVSFANMFQGEKRDVLVQVSVPKVSAPTFTSLLSANLQYSALGVTYHFPPAQPAPTSIFSSFSQSSTTAMGVSCGVERVNEGDERLKETRALEVDEQMNRALVARATSAAIAEADMGNMDEARRLLTEATAVLLSSPSHLSGAQSAAALLKELNDALESTVSREVYYRGGKNSMCETISVQDQQRSLYTKSGKMNMYQSPSSCANQSTFSSMKGKGV